MAAKEVRLSVFCFDPQKEEKPRYESYSVPYRDNLTILDALNFVKEEIDPALSFRQSCRAAICGSCALRINKRSGLA